MTARLLQNLTATDVAPEVFQDGRAAWHHMHSAVSVARRLEPEEPVLCFSEDALRERIQRFQAGFPGEVSYAVKANSSEDVIKTAVSAGLTVFDVASVEEMTDVRAFTRKAVFHYHNPVKSRAEILRAWRSFGCRRFAADDASEIRKIASTIGMTLGTTIAVRFRLPPHGASAHDFSTKFGATPDEAVELLKLADELNFGCALTFHPGSQCIDPHAWVRHIETAADIANRAGVDVCVLNVGGGFPARYLSGDVPAPEVFFSAIEDAARRYFPANTCPALECEPGRGIVAPCMSLLVRAKLVKSGRREIFLNDGIYGALMEAYQAPDLMPSYRPIRTQGQAFLAETQSWTAYGPTCDPLDVLPVQLRLPSDIEEGDYIEFGSIGAYGSATSTRFNGYGSFLTVPVRQLV